MVLRDVCEQADAIVTGYGFVAGTRIREQVNKSMGVLEEAVDRYSLDELALSFNGGKDCLVMLILFLAVLHRKRDNVKWVDRLQCIYVRASEPFEEVDLFVERCSRRYFLDVITITDEMKAAIAEFLIRRPKVKGILIGTRRTDPHGDRLETFLPTDDGWPEFMRIHPILHWHYSDIWNFLRATQTPYCTLYDFGYTSLGGIRDTTKNPALLVQGPGSISSSSSSSTRLSSRGSKESLDGRMYRPAYELVDDSEERLGRVSDT